MSSGTPAARMARTVSRPTPKIIHTSTAAPVLHPSTTTSQAAASPARQTPTPPPSTSLPNVPLASPAASVAPKPATKPTNPVPVDNPLHRRIGFAVEWEGSHGAHIMYATSYDDLVRGVKEKSGRHVLAINYGPGNIVIDSTPMLIGISEGGRRPL